MSKYNLPIRKIDILVGKKATLRLNDSRVLFGYCDCIAQLPINDESDEEDDFLRFISDDGTTLYISDSEIVGMDY